MRYDIRLQIDYQYSAPSDQLRNILRLIPQDSPHQRILQRNLWIDPLPSERRDELDFFANMTTLAVWHQPVAQVSFTLQAQAERLEMPHCDRAPLLSALPEAIAQAGGIAPAAPLHFRTPSARIALAPEIIEFAIEATPRNLTAYAAVAHFGRAVHDRIAFDPTATDAATPPETAFAAGRGVCQDMAQIMIAGLRGLGIPAGYVSGFLRTKPPPGQPKLAGVDAMHAWVTAWVGPEMGWVEYDPTNARWAGADYITVAWGRDYADAAPVRGAVRTAGTQTTSHAVDVMALEG